MTARKRILVIEDNEPLLNLFQSMLIQAGYDVDTAVNGRLGLEKIERFKPDLILLDIILPEVNGFDILRNLQEVPSTYYVPVIVLSDLGDEMNIKKCFELGARDFLVKSNVHLDDVVKKIEDVLSESHSSPVK